MMTFTQTRRDSRKAPSPRGFTIIELMVVVALIAMLLGFSVPLVFKLDELSRDRTGVNSFGVGVSAARAYASRRIADLDTVPAAEYSGAALLVTGSNEMRIIEDVQNDQMEATGRSEFRDVPRMEPIVMPRGMGVAGIFRDPAKGSGGVMVLPPPFAIRFNKHGQLVASGPADATVQGGWENIVYYDGDYNGTVDWGKSRWSSNFNPTQYDPDLSNVSSQFNTDRNQYRLPTEALECVVGVVVYSKADFEDAGGSLSGNGTGSTPSLGCKDGSCQSIVEWMFDNGSVLFFSRNTGTIIRTKRQ